MKAVRTLGLAGFNRHGDLPVFERWLAVDAESLAAIEGGDWQGRFDELLQALTGRSAARPENGGGDEPPACADRLAAAAIELQRAAGFRVSHSGGLAGSEDTPIRFFAEYDHQDAGLSALDLAADLLAAALDRPNEAGGDPASLESRFSDMQELGRRRATPLDARALIDAARRRDIPFYRMDREPYDPIRGPFRLRPEGLLRLGQARHQRTVDGNFCIERSEALHGLAKDRSAMFNRLREISFPLPMAVGPELRQCASPARAVRAARRAGFPVVLKSVHRRPGGVICGLEDEQAVSEAAGRLLAGGAVYVEPSMAGEVVELLYVGQRRFVALRRNRDGRTTRVPESELPPEALSAADGLAGRLELLCLSVALVLREPDAGGSAVVIDVDPAPPLDRLLGDMPELLERACDGMIDWLFPAQSESRIPIAAVTGTNGKTTTCFMVERIMREAGFRTGLACSTGSYLDGRETGQFEDGYLPGHLTVIDNASVTMGILETTRGGAASTGIGFDRCDVSACLNVSNDHLDDEMGIRNLDELARVKQWIVERGRRPVLNADDPRCRAMAGALRDRRPVLVSARSSAPELASSLDDTVCVVESIEGRDWIVLHEAGVRIDVVAVDEIPATFGGRAGHNTANALHAAAIARLMGAEPASIAAGLRAVRPDAREMPARLNHYRCDDIDIIVDYAHNPDGLARLAAFCDRFEAAGRRLIAVTLPADRGDDFVLDGVAGVAGRFDHYVCKNYRIRYGREPHEVPQLLRSGLRRGGVPDERITLIEDEDEAILQTLHMARPGDLVVLVVGKEFREQGRMVEEFVARRGGSTAA